MVSKDGSDRRFRVKELLKYKIKSDIVFSPLNIYLLVFARFVASLYKPPLSQ